MKALCLNDNRFACVPDSALVTRANPWFEPEDGVPGEWQASLWLGAVIDRLGRCIARKFASRYYSQAIVAAHPHNPDAEAQWWRDGALIVGTGTIDPIPASLSLDIQGNAAVTVENPALLLDEAVSWASAYATLKTGDLVLVPLDINIPLRRHDDVNVSLGDLHLLKLKTR